MVISALAASRQQQTSCKNISGKSGEKLKGYTAKENSRLIVLSTRKMFNFRTSSHEIKRPIRPHPASL